MRTSLVIAISFHSVLFDWVVIGVARLSAMGLVTGLVGASWGLFVTTLTNGIKRVPLFRRASSLSPRQPLPLAPPRAPPAVGGGDCVVSDNCSHSESSLPARVGPWEHLIFGVIGGSWVAHKYVQSEEWSTATLEYLLVEKLKQNDSVCARPAHSVARVPRMPRVRLQPYILCARIFRIHAPFGCSRQSWCSGPIQRPVS